MARLIRKLAILAKLESAYGVDVHPAGATDAVLLSEASIEYQYNNVDRDLIRPFLGGSDQLVGTRHVEIKGSVELAGSGTKGVAPAWGNLLCACGFAETVEATKSVTYTPVSEGFDSLTIYYYLDGVVHKALGARGTVTFALGEGERPLAEYTFTGLDGGPAVAALPTSALAIWKTPAVVTDPNSPGLKLGATLAAGVVSGGTSYAGRGLQLDVGNQVQYVPMLGGQTVEITQRACTGSMQLDLSATQEVDFRTAINANTATSLAFAHGSTDGNKLQFFAPAVQRINPKMQDFNGVAHLGMDLRINPVAGNDELQIIVS